MLALGQYATAEALEQYLGDPGNPENLFSFRHSMELDERDQYPEAIYALLNDWKVYEYYIPEELGGKLKSWEEMLAIARVIARRDLTVAIAHGCTYLGASPVWLSGSTTQKHRVAELIRNQEQISFGLTEKNHGSDILASETRVEKTDSGYLLTGEKWLIGNASRSKALAVFARTQAKGGPRGFSLFLVEKNQLDPTSYGHLPKIKTHGLRGANICGITFHDSHLNSDTLIEPMGAGLEIILKAFQITRTLHAGAAPSLGQADTALRVTLSFALSRELYGGTVWDIDHVRQSLIDVFADILICDCMSIAAVRALHAATEQMSLISAIIKYFVPTTTEDLLHRLAAILGARFYLREEHCWGIFQKIVRDHAIISVFDGSTAVNLHGIALQLPTLAAYRSQTDIKSSEGIKERLATIFDLQQPLPDFDPQKLEIYNRGRDDILQSIEIAIADLYNLKSNPGDVSSDVVQQILTLTCEIQTVIEAQEAHLATMGSNAAKSSKSREMFTMSKQYCALHAAVACVQMWLHNRPTLGAFFQQGEWLVVCLHRLMSSFYRPLDTIPPSYLENMGQEMLRLYAEDKLFSIVPLHLAKKDTLGQNPQEG